MKAIIFPSILAVFAVGTSFRGTQQEISAIQALKNGWIKVDLIGKGGHSGSCVKLDVQNLKRSPLKIRFNPGNLLNSKINSEQDLLIAKEQEVILAENQKRSADLKAYCCQSQNIVPQFGSSFKLTNHGSDKIHKLTKFMNALKLPDNIIQSAVWSVSNDAPVSNISYFQSDSKVPGIKRNVDSLRNFVCKLTGRANPWFSTPQQRVITTQRMVASSPVEVFGSISYELKENSRLHYELLNPNGQLIYSNLGEQEMSKGKWDYNFSLKVSGYPKGEYLVRIKTDQNLITEQKFII